MTTAKRKHVATGKTKGHWPKGKHRNPDCGNWSRTLLLLGRLLDEHWDKTHINQESLSRAVGIHSKTLWQFRHGLVRPAPETQDAILQWVLTMRAAIKKQNARKP